jgi:hypothetical protein
MGTTNARRLHAARAVAAALAALALDATSLAAQRAPARVANIRQLTLVAAAPGERLEIVLDRAVTPEAAREAPDLLAIELDATRPAYGVHGRVFEGGLVAEIRLLAVGVPSRPRARLAIRTRGPSTHRIRVDGNRIVVELVPEGFELAPAVSAPAAPLPAAPPAAAPTAPVPLPEPVPVAAAPKTAELPSPLVESTIFEEDLPEARIEEAPAEVPPPLTPAAVPGLDAAPPTAPLAALAPEPAAAPAPRLREIYSVAPEAVPPLAVEARPTTLDELAPSPAAAGAPRLREIFVVEAETVAALDLPSPLTTDIAAALPANVESPVLRVVLPEEPEPDVALVPIAPIATAVEPAPATPPATAPGPEPPPTTEEATTMLPDEVVRADELVPPAEIARPLPAPPLPIQPSPPATRPSPATRVLGIERIEPGVVRITADGVLTYLSFRLENPERFVLELAGVVDASPVDSLQVDEPLLLRVRVGQYRHAPRPVTRVVFDLRTPSIPEIESTPTGLVVRFVRAVPRVAAAPQPPPAAAATNRSFSTLASLLTRASSRNAALQDATSSDQTNVTGRRARV